MYNKCFKLEEFSKYEGFPCYWMEVGKVDSILEHAKDLSRANALKVKQERETKKAKSAKLEKT